MAHVRAVRREDASAWLQLRQALWPDESGSHASEIRDFFAGRRRIPLEVLMAFEDDRPVGFVELSIRPYAEGCDTDRVAFLEGWYVVPERRRLGIGRALVDAAEAWGRAQGCTEFASDTNIDNDASAAAHQALGFEEVEQIRCFRKLLR
jgi:aminoglycoside 6'-N-acetyltransferase I